MQYTQYCTGCTEILTDPLSCTDSSTFSLVSNKDERKFVSSKGTAQMYSTIRTRQPRCGSLNIILTNTEARILLNLRIANISERTPCIYISPVNLLHLSVVV